MNQNNVLLTFSSPPSAVMGYLRALLARPSGLIAGQAMPNIEAKIEGLSADSAQVQKYREICGFGNDGKLPVTFPHIMASGFHLMVLTHKAFPYKLLGAVHLRNEIIQHRAIGESEKLNLKVQVNSQRDVAQGMEVDMLTEYSDVKGQCVWLGTSTFLIRLKAASETKKQETNTWTPPDFSQYQSIAQWDAPENIGRRYGPVAGDMNPIHMHALSARAFGFKRAIAHGMWTFACSVAQTTREYRDGQLALQVAFKRPLFLPGKAFLYSRNEQGKTEFLLSNAQNDTVYLTGQVIVS